jgi:hypothetical protein
MDILTTGEALLVLVGIVLGIVILWSFDRRRRRRSDDDPDGPPTA